MSRSTGWFKGFSLPVLLGLAFFLWFSPAAEAGKKDTNSSGETASAETSATEETGGSEAKPAAPAIVAPDRTPRTSRAMPDRGGRADWRSRGGRWQGVLSADSSAQAGAVPEARGRGLGWGRGEANGLTRPGFGEYRTAPPAVTDGRRMTPAVRERPQPAGRMRPDQPERVMPTPRVEVQRSAGRWTQRLQQQIQSENSHARGQARPQPRQLTVTTPSGQKVTPKVLRHSHREVERNAAAFRHRFGEPGFQYVLVPRTTSDFSVAYSLGYSAGLHFGAAHRHRHHPVVMFCYYPFYFEDPYFVGFWYRGYYPSIYYYYGWLPRWCYPPSIVVHARDPYPFYFGWWEGTPRTQHHYYYYYYSSPPALDERGVDRALADIRRAWLEGDIDRLAYHIQESEKISVYFDNDYSYSVSGDDFYAMTLDAMSSLKTLDVAFSEPTWLNSREVFVTGQHIFLDPEGERQKVYLSFRLHRYDDRWYIIGAGSSPKPIKNIYQDFRTSRRS